MSRISGLGSIGRYGPVQQQDTSGAGNPTLGPDPRFSGLTGIQPFDPRYLANQGTAGNPLVRNAFLRGPTQNPALMQTGANPQYEQAMHAQQIADTSHHMTAAATAWRAGNVNGGHGLYAMGPNGHALGAGSNVGQNGFGTFGGMMGSGQTSNANKDTSGALGGAGAARGGAGIGAGGAGLRPGGLGGIGAGPGGSSAGGQLQGLVDSTNQANEGRYNQLLGLSGKLSDAQMQREKQRQDWQLGRVDQQAITSGLAGTTILPNLERGVVDDSALRQNEVSDQGIRSQMGIIQGRTDAPPNLGLYAGLLSQAGAGGAGGGYGGYGGGPMLGAGVGGSHPNTFISQPGPDPSSYGGGGYGAAGRGGLGGIGQASDNGQGFGGTGGDFNGAAAPPSGLMGGVPGGYAAQQQMLGWGAQIGANAGANMAGMGPGLGWSWGVDPRKY